LNNSVRVFAKELSVWAQLMTLYNMSDESEKELHQKWRKTS